MINMDGLIWLSVIFLVLALVAYVLGARGIAGFNMEIAKWIVITFVILAVLVILFGGRVVPLNGETPTPVITPVPSVTPTPLPDVTVVIDENGECKTIAIIHNLLVNVTTETNKSNGILTLRMWVIRPSA